MKHSHGRAAKQLVEAQRFGRLLQADVIHDENRDETGSHAAQQAISHCQHHKKGEGSEEPSQLTYYAQDGKGDANKRRDFDYLEVGDEAKHQAGDKIQSSDDAGGMKHNIPLWSI